MGNASNTQALSNAIQRILIPNIVLFFIGWLMGATKILLPPSVYVLNMTALYWIFPCAVFSGFLNFPFTGFDFFFFLFNIIAKFVMFIPAIVPYCFYKINLRMVCALWLTAVYNDAITYALYYLSVFYTEPKMMTWISLSTVPSNIIFFPIVVFMLEYHDYKNKLRKSATGLMPTESGNVTDTSTFRIVLSIVLRVVKNPLVWAGVSGIVLNQAVLQPGGKFPVWFTEIFILSRACTMPINMFLLGVFTSTYGPIHSNVMKILCCIVSPLKRLCGFSNEEVSGSTDQPGSSSGSGGGGGGGSSSSSSDISSKNSIRSEEEDDKENRNSSSSSSSSSKFNPSSVLHAAAVDEENRSQASAKPPVWGEKMSALAEEGRNKHGLGIWEKDGAPRPTSGGEELEMEIETEMDDEVVRPVVEEKERERVKERVTIVVSPQPTAAAAAAPAAAPGAPAAGAGAAPGAPKSSDDYKFNFWLLLTEIVIRHVISPAVMLLLCVIFTRILTPIQKHCMVVMTAFGTGGPVFVLGRQYNAYPGEAAVTQVAGAFILNVVFFVIFYYICQAIWPI